MRIDKFLWSVRLFKSRSLASDSVRDGKVEVEGVRVKASREVGAGDEITVRRGAWSFQCRVLAVPSSRVGPKLVEEYIKDITPQEDRERRELLREARRNPLKSLGRPTKRDRRKLDDWAG